jgi:hypothetical protein
MIFIKKKYNNIFLAVLCVVLLFSIFYWISFLTINKYIVECFIQRPISEYISESTSYSVDLPLTTKYSCKNFCGPTSRCSITGQQCSADIDCPGCKPYSIPLSESGKPIPGDNDAGKMTNGVTPQYSPLTSGYGTKERVITSNMFSKPSMPNFGGNMWLSQFKKDQNLFDKRYKPSNLEFMPSYPKRYSLSGQFVEDGPFASNSPDLY